MNRMLPFNRPNACMSLLMHVFIYIQSSATRVLLSLHTFCYLRTIHNQGVNDPISSLSAAHSLHAAVVVAQCEMGFRAIVHKLALQVKTHEELRLGHSIAYM